MEPIFISIITLLLMFFLNRYLLIENLALRHQLILLKKHVKRPKIGFYDRIFWVFLLKYWEGWKNSLVFVQPETVIKWHRKGFKLFWKLKSRKHVGRPAIDPDTRKLIENMAITNPLWGAPRIHGELLKLGFDIHERTVSKIIQKYRTGKPPSQTWKTFLKNHMFNTYSIDFLTVPTVSFKILYVFVILYH